MKPIRHILTLAALAAAAMPLHALSIEEARTLAEDGEMAAAIAMLEQLEAEQPRNAEIPCLLGDYYLATGADAEALRAYEAAKKNGNRNATLALANMAANRYEVGEARTLLAAYKASLKKGKKVLATDESGDLEERITRIENMLDRVEQIEIIDSLVVDAEDFFRYYRLSPESGSLNPASVLPDGFEAADPTVVYEPQSRRSMVWSAPDSEGNYTLFSSDALYGNEWERPTPLGDNLGEGGDANYPFLMPDGITLYYANDGENSLGGLDIFISRRNGDTFFSPQNLGMPYNSPYDDYMLAIDEITGVGWWATDRNRIPGKVTIYVFIPSELRINVDPDSPDIASRARISSIRDTWTDTERRNSLIRKIMAIAPGPQTEVANEFVIAIPGRGVLTRFEQLRTPRGKKAMADYLESASKLAHAEEQLAKLREAYSRGDRSAEATIRALESQITKSRAELLALRNEVINLEQ